MTTSSLLLVASLGLFLPHSRAAATCGSAALAKAADTLAAKFDAHQFVFIGSTHGDAKIE
jgi:hypothetical protein